MTEPLTDREEMNRRAKAFQFEPSPSLVSPGEFNEFPTDARPIIRTVMSVYGKEEEDQEEVGDQHPVVDPALTSSSSDVRSGTSSSTNSDSGIGYRDDADHILLMDPQSPPIGNAQLVDHVVVVEDLENEIQENNENEEKERFDVRAMPPPKDLSPDVEGAHGGGGGHGDDSFNTEVLDSQHSAANLRQSMQKYLQSKQEHLKKSSQQLIENRPSQFAQTLMMQHQVHSFEGNVFFLTDYN